MVLDKRLVRTFLRAVQVIIEFHHHAYGLLLSELGTYILTPSQAPAGTKRLSNLLRSSKWTCSLFERFHGPRADARLTSLEEAGETALVVCDESVIAKTESEKLEGWCSVRSSTRTRV